MHVLISTRQPQDEAREFASWLRPFVTISVSCIAVVLFFLARNLIHRLASNADFLLPAFVLATAIALLVLRVSYDGLGSIYKTLARTTAAGLIAYLVLEPPSFTLADQAYAHVAA